MTLTSYLKHHRSRNTPNWKLIDADELHTQLTIPNQTESTYSSFKASHVLLYVRQFVYTTNNHLQSRQMSMTYCGLYLDILRNLLCGGEIMSNQQGSEKFQTQNIDIPLEMPLMPERTSLAPRRWMNSREPFNQRLSTYDFTSGFSVSFQWCCLMTSLCWIIFIWSTSTAWANLIFSSVSIEMSWMIQKN